MRQAVAAVLLVVCSIPALASAQTLPQLRGGSVDARVERTASGYFKYQYRVSCNATEPLEISVFAVDAAQGADRTALDVKGLPAEAPRVLSGSKEQRKETIGKAVALSISGIPSHWNAAIDSAQRVNWGSSAASSPLTSGGQLSGFEISSYGLPGIRDGRLEPDLWEFLPNVDEHPELGFVYGQIPASTQVAKTVGPVAPPAFFTPPRFVAEIKGMLAEARVQGWIGSDESKKILADELDQIERSMEAGDSDAGRLRANAFIELVSSMSCAEFDCSDGRALSSEAYALFRFNMEYLRDRL